MPDPRFIADANVGRLARWLRIAGYDTLFIPGIEDEDLVRLARREGRIILTRDSSLVRRRLVSTGKVKALLIRSDDPRSQLRQVVEECGLADGSGPSLCIECNATMAWVDREVAKDRVPPFVFQTQAGFMECPSCHRLFWRGTHWHSMHQELSRLKGGPR